MPKRKEAMCRKEKKQCAGKKEEQRTGKEKDAECGTRARPQDTVSPENAAGNGAAGLGKKNKRKNRRRNVPLEYFT